MQKATDYFASFLDHSENMLEVSGRLAVQEGAEKLIVQDICEKLKIKADDSLLEIGCGAGNLLIPLSFMTKKCVGVDHQRLVEKAENRFKGDNIDYIAGHFPNVNITGSYDKILIYSVLAYMDDETKLFEFLEEALKYLKPSGRMLLGDIACVSHKERFIESDAGKAFQQEWQEATAKNPGTAMPAPECSLMTIDDELVARMLLFFRKKGCHSYILEQNKNLPFGNTREDMVIVGKENLGN